MGHLSSPLLSYDEILQIENQEIKTNEINSNSTYLSRCIKVGTDLVTFQPCFHSIYILVFVCVCVLYLSILIFAWLSFLQLQVLLVRNFPTFSSLLFFSFLLPSSPLSLEVSWNEDRTNPLQFQSQMKTDQNKKRRRESWGDSGAFSK